GAGVAEGHRRPAARRSRDPPAGPAARRDPAAEPGTAGSEDSLPGQWHRRRRPVGAARLTAERAPRERPQRAPGPPLVDQKMSGNLPFTADADCRRRSELILTFTQTAAFCLGLYFVLIPKPPLRAGEEVGDPSEELLRQVKVGTDNASLFAYLR